jgi:hypothetical protein
MPYLAKKSMEKMQASQQQAYQQFKQKKKAEEGKVTISKAHKQNPPTESSNGEYVDFEEVK